MRAYRQLALGGCQILSPHRIDFPLRQADFMMDAEESRLTPGEVERHHLMCIRQSDFVWLHAKDGYIGPGAAFEIGYAKALQVPIFSDAIPTEVVFATYVRTVASVFEVLEIRGRGR